ncbi:MAG: hypothetical protein QW303_04175 [Nitrososphaerota archaeon]
MREPLENLGKSIEALYECLKELFERNPGSSQESLNSSKDLDQESLDIESVSNRVTHLLQNETLQKAFNKIFTFIEQNKVSSLHMLLIVQRKPLSQFIQLLVFF